MKNSHKQLLIIAIIIAITTFACIKITQKDNTPIQKGLNTHMNEITTPSGLKYTIIKEGTGNPAKSGDTVSVHYIGTFLDGKKFDSSRDRGDTFDVTIDRTGVIAGWHEGLKGMKLGEQRKLVIPSNLAYGPNNHGPIPGGSTLVFDIELMKFK